MDIQGGDQSLNKIDGCKSERYKAYNFFQEKCYIALNNF